MDGRVDYDDWLRLMVSGKDDGLTCVVGFGSWHLRWVTEFSYCD